MNVCPFSRAALSSLSSSNITSSSIAKCPYQQLFDQQSTLSSENGYHASHDFVCTVCKSYINDYVTLAPCKHSFCAFCQQKFSTCPSCNTEVTDVKKDKYKQFLISSFIDAQWARVYTQNQQQNDESTTQGDEAPINPFSAFGTSSNLGEEVDKTISKSLYYMHLALQAQQGSNYPAAKERSIKSFQIASSFLNAKIPKSGAEFQKERNSLSTIVGMISRQVAEILISKGCNEADAKDAEEYYQCSLMYLERCDLQNAETLQSFVVSLLKLGDYQLNIQKNESEALKTYLRVSSVLGKSKVPTEPAALIELVLFYMKVGDLQKRQQQNEEARLNYQKCLAILEQALPATGDQQPSEDTSSLSHHLTHMIGIVESKLR